MPPVRVPTYGETPSTLHTTPYEHHTYLLTPPRRDTYDVDTTYERIPICTMATGGSAAVASEIEVHPIYPTILELRTEAAKQADSCVAGVAWCGMWRSEGVSPYVGIRIGGIWWVADWLKTTRTTQSQAEQTTRVCLGFIRQKKAQCVLDQ